MGREHPRSALLPPKSCPGDSGRGLTAGGARGEKCEEHGVPRGPAGQEGSRQQLRGAPRQPRPTADQGVPTELR